MPQATRFCRAAVWKLAGEPPVVREVSVPTLRPGEALVRISHCTLCQSDLHTIYGRRDSPAPSILGHETIGRIEAICDRTDGFQVGERVTWTIVAHCGSCYFCRRDLTQKCERGMKFGHQRLAEGRDLFGGLAEYCVLPAQATLFRIPPDIADEVACPANCATATVAAAFDGSGDLAGRSVLILGAGMLGLTACAWSRHGGARQILCVERLLQRQRLATQFGATHSLIADALPDAVAEATDGIGVDLLFDFVGSPPLFEQSLPWVRTGGTVNCVGAVYAAPPVPLSMESVVRRCLTIRGIHNYQDRHLRNAIDFLRECESLPFASLVGMCYPLASVAEAVAEAETGRWCRVGVHCG